MGEATEALEPLRALAARESSPLTPPQGGRIYFEDAHSPTQASAQPSAEELETRDER